MSRLRARTGRAPVEAAERESSAQASVPRAAKDLPPARRCNYRGSPRAGRCCSRNPNAQSSRCPHRVARDQHALPVGISRSCWPARELLIGVACHPRARLTSPLARPASAPGPRRVWPHSGPLRRGCDRRARLLLRTCRPSWRLRTASRRLVAHEAAEGPRFGTNCLVSSRDAAA